MSEVEVYEDPQEQAHRRMRERELVDMLVGLRARGLNWYQIEKETGIDPAYAAMVVNDYLLSNYNRSSALEMRMLQLVRLESIVNALWPQVMSGDLITEGKQTKNLIDTLTTITELMELKKDRLRDEQVELTRVQKDMVHTMLAGVRDQMLSFVEDRLARLPRGDEEAVRIRREIADGWAARFAEVATEAMTANSTRTSKGAK